MAYDTALASRVEDMLAELNLPLLENKKMFGGVSCMVQGNMACGVLDDYLIVRVGKDAYEDALRQPGTSEFGTTGRPMTGWVKVQPSALQTAADLQAWVLKGLAFALALPAK